MTAQNPTADPKPQPGLLQLIVLGRNPKTTLIRILVLVAVCFVVFKFILLPIRVDGISMEPTYKDHSINFLNRLAYWRHEPRRGDVVNIRLAGIHVVYMKRIVGLPGETIAFENGRVIVDGTPLAEPYEKNPCDWTLPPVKLDTNEYFVVGDNRTMPPGDHKFGAVARERIIGKVIL